MTLKPLLLSLLALALASGCHVEKLPDAVARNLWSSASAMEENLAAAPCWRRPAADDPTLYAACGGIAWDIKNRVTDVATCLERVSARDVEVLGYCFRPAGPLECPADETCPGVLAWHVFQGTGVVTLEWHQGEARP